MTEAPPADRRRAQHAWCWYDWANSAFTTTVMAAVLPPYFARVAAEGLPGHLATAYWGYATSAVLAISAIGAPLLAAFVAARRAQRSMLAILVAVGASATLALAFAGRGEWALLLVAYSLAFLAFSWSIVIYDGLLVAVAEPHERDRVSSRGFAWGYAGGGLLLALHAGWIVKPGLFGFADAAAASRAAFASVAIWWAAFALPLLRARIQLPAGGAKGGLRATWSHLRGEIASFRSLRAAWVFLVAFWLYNDAFGTVGKMATVYGASLGFGTGHLVGALLLVQIVAVPATLAAGALARRVGARSVILGCIAIYVGVALLGLMLSRPIHFWILSGLVGLALGGMQALSRSLFARLVPAERATEMFGFYNVSSRVGGVLGTFLFAAVSQLTGSARFGSLAILPFLIVGGLLLLTVPDPRADDSSMATKAQT